MGKCITCPTTNEYQLDNYSCWACTNSWKTKAVTTVSPTIEPINYGHELWLTQPWVKTKTEFETWRRGIDDSIICVHCCEPCRAHTHGIGSQDGAPGGWCLNTYLHPDIRDGKSDEISKKYFWWPKD